MANEIRLTYESGLSNLTADVYSPDGGTQRASDVALSDSGHAGLYLGDCVTIQSGDVIIFYQNSVYLTGQTYEPAWYGTIDSSAGGALDINICNQSLNMLGAENISAAKTDTTNYGYCENLFPLARDEVMSAHFWNFALIRGLAVETDPPQYGYDYAYLVPNTLPNGNTSPHPACLRVRKLAEWKYKWRSEKDISGNKIIVTNQGSTPDDWADDTDYIKGDAKSYNSITYLCNTGHHSNKGSGTNTDTPDGSSYWTSTGGDYRVLSIEYLYQVTALTGIHPFLKQAIIYALTGKLTSAITQSAEDVKVFYELSNDYLRRAKSIDAQEGAPTTLEVETWINSRQ